MLITMLVTDNTPVRAGDPASCVTSERHLLSGRRGALLAVMCFISTHTGGFLYLVGGQRTRLLQTYSYTSQGVVTVGGGQTRHRASSR